MVKALKISAIVLTAAFATGCANTAAIENLQSQIDSLTTQISTAAADAASAQSSAASAAARASAAENHAAQLAQDTNSKLDRVFKQSMMK